MFAWGLRSSGKEKKRRGGHEGNTIMDSVAAKQFLISKVIQEAELSNVQLSETERKMLYFTEAQPSLPDILDVNAEFERAYDADEYEDKIAESPEESADAGHSNILEQRTAVGGSNRRTAEARPLHYGDGGSSLWDWVDRKEG